MAIRSVKPAGGRDSAVVGCRMGSGTSLSGGEAVGHSRGSRKGSLARTSLVVLFASMLTESCLLPEPPSYREPERTPPFLWGPIPATIEVQSVNSGDPFNISVNLRSEDAGEDLVALLFLNYLVEGQQSGGFSWTPVKAGTLSEERHIEISSWQVPERQTPGTCEQLSLIVSHLSNYGSGGLPMDDSDVAILTWWLDINGTEQTLASCAKSRNEVSP